MTSLLLAAAELVEEIVNFSTSFFFSVINFLDIESDQCGLDKRHDLFEQLSLFFFDRVLVK